MTLITADHLEVLFIGNLGGFDRHAVTASVDGARFFHENVLTGVHGVSEVNRTETRSRRDDNGIALVNRLLVSVETEENAVLQIIAIVFHFGIRVRGRFRGRLESVGNRDNFNVVADVKTLLESATTTTAATDERKLDKIATGSVRAARYAHAAYYARASEDAGRLQKITSFHYLSTPELNGYSTSLSHAACDATVIEFFFKSFLTVVLTQILSFRLFVRRLF